MKPSYYAIIPADVRYSDLKPNAKLLYGEITALSSKEGYCFATNRYFAELYNVTKNTISLWISQLQKKGFVSVLLIKKGEQITERRIAIIKKDDRSIVKNNEHSSIKNSNTINISLREMKFGNQVSEESIGILSVDEANEFLSYWKELNKSKSNPKMRWELEKTWNIKSRMQRWKNNQKKWNKKSINSFKKKINTFINAKEQIEKINKFND